MSAQVLHLDLAALSPATSAEDRRQLIEAAGCLTSLAEVTSAGVIEASPSTGSGRSDEADFELAFFFLLPEFAALEHFGTDPLYARFLRGRLAPLLRSFAGVDVRLEGEFPAMSEHAACLALTAPEETYDWEVAAALRRWASGLDARSLAVGLAVGERQRYRGLALVFADQPIAARRPEAGAFLGRVTLITGRARTLP